jgi:hypothetical protein
MRLAAAQRPPRQFPPRCARLSAARRAARPQQPPATSRSRGFVASASLAAPAAPLWGARPAGSHPAAFDADPPFAALPALNDDALCARLLGRGARQRLGRLDADAAALAFAGEHPYARLSRAVADAGCVDAKELVEALEFFHRVRRRVRRHTVVECVRFADTESARLRFLTCACFQRSLACGHGLVGLLFGAFERDVERVLLLDARLSASHATLLNACASVAPWLPAKVTMLRADLARLPGGAAGALAAGGGAVIQRHAGSRRVGAVPSLLAASDADETDAAAALLRAMPPGSAGFVAVHACGALTDVCLGVAAAAQGPVAVLPCCFTGTAAGAPTALRRALGVSLAADVARVYRLEAAGFTADFVAVPAAATPMNRGIIAVPRRQSADTAQDLL